MNGNPRSFTTPKHQSLFAGAPAVNEVAVIIKEVLCAYMRPSARELFDRLDQRLDLTARWAVVDAIQRMLEDRDVTVTQKQYLRDLMDSEEWLPALRGVARPAREIESTVDGLFHQSAAYRNTESFREMISFMANFREYAPFNNMLVRLQRPECSFFAAQRDWVRRFRRVVKEDARPIVILAPMHPVMFVYDLDSTEGPDLPKELREFARFKGDWDLHRLQRTRENARIRDLIRIDEVELSSTNAGFATVATGNGGMKMRIGLHNKLDAASQYGVMLHELAHIYLGHLGGDPDGWWPCRGDLGRHAMEIEAEAVAYIVARRAGLEGSSAAYVSSYLKGDDVLAAVSLDQVAKVAGRLDDMGMRTMTRRKPRAVRAQGARG